MDQHSPLALRVRRRVPLAPDIISIELACPEGSLLPAYEAGAHVDVHTGPGLIRQYSLWGDPAEKGTYRIAVKREPASRGGSSWMHDAVVPGMELRIGAPRNNFALSRHAGPSVLVAGGIGITPLLSMAHVLRREGRSFALYHFARSPANAGFDGLLADGDLAAHCHRFYGDDRDRISRRLEEIVGGCGDDAHLYLCGPTGFMDRVRDLTRHWPAGRLHLEHFAATVPTTGGAFTVVLARSNARVLVAEGQTIADALAAAGHDVPLSCQQGVCGTCLTGVVEGIPDHRDLFQSAEEQAENRFITPCVSRALSAELVLDL